MIDNLQARHGLDFELLDGFLYPGHSRRRMHSLPQRTALTQGTEVRQMGQMVCIQPPRVPSQIAGHGGAAYALARQPEGTSAGSRLGGGVLSIQAMTAPCR